MTATMMTAAALTIVKTRTTKQLVHDFLVTSTIDHKLHPEVFTVRGWLLDELEHRNPKAMDRWLSQGMPLDEDLPRYFC